MGDFSPDNSPVGFTLITDPDDPWMMMRTINDNTSAAGAANRNFTTFSEKFSGYSEQQITDHLGVSRTFIVKGGGTGDAVTTICALGGVFTRDGHTFIQGGQVTGGMGNEEAEEIDLGPTESLPTSGYLYIACAYTATVVSGVLLPGGDLTGVTTTIHGASVPPNDIPTASDPDGVLYIVLATYTASGVLPTGCGNIQISHCPGSLTYQR